MSKILCLFNLGFSVYNSTKPSTENAPSPTRIEEEKGEHASPGSNAAESPQLPSTATSPVSMPLLRPNNSGAVDQGSESSWGSGEVY